MELKTAGGYWSELLCFSSRIWFCHSDNVCNDLVSTATSSLLNFGSSEHVCVCCVAVDSQASWREWVLCRWENLSHFLNSSTVPLSCAEVNRKTEQQTEQLRNNQIPHFHGAGVHAVKHFIKGGRLCLVHLGRCCGLSPVPGGSLTVISKTVHNTEAPGDALPKCCCC